MVALVDGCGAGLDPVDVVGTKEAVEYECEARCDTGDGDGDVLGVGSVVRVFPGEGTRFEGRLIGAGRCRRCEKGREQ